MNDITIGKYRTLVDVSEYKLLENLNPINLFNEVEFNKNSITYKDVRSIVKLLKTGNDWNSLYSVFEIMYGITETDFYKCSIVEFYSCRNYVFDYIMSTQKQEASLLKSISNDSELWRTAGGDRLNKFSDIMPLIQIGEIFSLYPFDLQDKPYVEILVLLVALKERAEVTQAFSKLKHKINK